MGGVNWTTLLGLVMGLLGIWDLGAGSEEKTEEGGFESWSSSSNWVCFGVGRDGKTEEGLGLGREEKREDLEYWSCSSLS